jgi:E3 ubiquitin-protein ligase HECTD4
LSVKPKPIYNIGSSTKLSISPLSPEAKVEAQIVSLLLSKLSDYLIPQSETLKPADVEPTSGLDDMDELTGCSETLKPEMNRPEATSKLSLFVHKRKDQSAHEIIQVYSFQ